MSALGLILSFLMFAIGPFGLFAFFLGVLMFIAGPVIPKTTGELHALARLHLWTATRMLKRAAFIITPQNDLLCKRISPDDTGTELVKFKDSIKEFEDPANRLHWWYGIPFAIADEIHGIFFDPRDAAIGAREKHLSDADSLEFPATADETENHAVLRWAHAVYELPENRHEIVNLAAFRQLVQGMERAEHPQQVKTFYENARKHLMEGTSTVRWMLLIAAGLGPFVVVGFLAGQMGGSGGGGSVVGFGAGTLLLASTGHRSTLKSVLVTLLVMLPLAGGFVLLFAFVSPVIAIFMYLLIGAGFWAVPVLSLLFGRLSTTVADSISGILFRLGFSGYDEPVFEWTSRRYRVRELSDLEDVNKSDAAWYGFAGELVGFTFQPGADSFGDVVADRDEMENKAVKQGGKSSIPADLRIWDGHVRDRIGGVIPKTLKDACYYVRSGIYLEQFTYAATGQKSNTRLTQSKEEFGEEGSIDDSRFGLLMAVETLFSLSLGVVVFLL